MRIFDRFYRVIAPRCGGAVATPACHRQGRRRLARWPGLGGERARSRQPLLPVAAPPRSAGEGLASHRRGRSQPDFHPAPIRSARWKTSLRREGEPDTPPFAGEGSGEGFVPGPGMRAPPHWSPWEESEMSLQIGIVGLPNVGRARSSTPSPGPGRRWPLPLHHHRPQRGGGCPPGRAPGLVGSAHPAGTVVPATVEFVDIAGLVRSAHRGGLGNQFLHHIRNVDAVALVVRGFLDADIPTSPKP